jgi:DNA-binding SARP family transcriptional activator
MPETPEILLLGELSLGRGNALPASKKTRALLGYLAVTKTPHTREELCDLLWQGPDDPRAALRWSLTKLRSVLGAGAIDADRERVVIGKVRTDLDAAREWITGGVESASVESLCAARRYFRGELLDGLYLPDCYRFHQWSTMEREKARALRLSVLSALGERHRSEPERALEFARERLSLDPLAEAAHVEVITLLAELGRKRDALAQFESSCRLLEREAGVRPSARLLEAKMRIGAATASVPPPRAEVAPVLVSKPAGIVGRDRELELVRRAARGDTGQVLLVLGEPGIGKTRLLDELGEESRALGGEVLAGRAFEAEMVRPYGPWLDALSGIEPARVPSSLREALGELMPALGAAQASGLDRASLFAAVLALLSALAEKKGPVALLIDDLQWCDEATAALLHYVARGVGKARVVIALGARRGELEDNPAALRLVRALARDGRSRPLELGPLPPEALARLARSVASEGSVERVVRESSGNPLFALELARALERGEGSAQDSLDGLVAERVARLDEPARELLAWAAALGTRFDVPTLEHVTGTPPLELGTRLGELERRGILRASSDGAAFDFVHDLVRSGAYRQLSEPRRRGVHHSIARALDALDGEDARRAGDVAHHAALGGDAGLAARASLAAAKRSIRMFAGAEAARLADFGIQQIGALPRREQLGFEVSFLSLVVFSGAGVSRGKAMKDALARAVTQAQDAGLHAEVIVGLSALSTLQYDSGDFGGAHGTTLRVVDAVRTAEPLTRARELGHSARCLAMLERDMVHAHAMYDEAREVCAKNDSLLVSVEWAGALLSAFDGDEARASSGFLRVLDLARKDEDRAEYDRWAEYECLRALVQLELESAAPPRESRYASELLAVAGKMGEGSFLPTAQALDALLRLRHETPCADDAVREAVATLRDVDAKGMLAYTLTLAAEIDVESGRFAEAEERAEEALRAANVVGRLSQTALARAVLARAALGRGDRELARSHFDAASGDLENPLAVSARARSAVARLAASFRG